MRLKPTLRGSLGALALGLLWAAPARAITATIADQSASVAGSPKTFDLVVKDAVGPVQVRWDLGDETRFDFTVGAIQQVHPYAAPGHYSVLVTVQDDVGFTGLAFVQTVHEPLTAGRPSGSSDLVYDQPSHTVWSANYDNDTVTAVDAKTLTKLGEVPVSRGPISLAVSAGKLWVLHRDAHSLSIVDIASLSVEKELMLPYASQPMGLAISPVGDVAYVSLMATGKLLKLDVATGEVLGEADVGSSARGISVSHDGAQIYVTRFITLDESHGEVVRFDNQLVETARIELAADSTTEDTDQKGRGLPNYLFSVALSPDGLWAWVPGKKDNIYRGLFRDTVALSDDNTVRPMIALLNVADGLETFARRIDLDDRNLPNQVAFTPLGDYAFVAVAGSALIEVRDAYTGGFVTALKETGFAPRGLLLTEDNKLFVHASLSRTLAVYDADEIVTSVAQTAKHLADISTVETEKLAPDVLRGKQLFFHSGDVRMSDQGYISCASCHFDGGEDGRVWDFGSVGEGLRNSVSLLGRRGTAQGNVNWSGSFDEIQDADDNIRNLFGGKGFLSAEQLAQGTVGTPLGDAKKGLSPELDALAAFVSSLDTYHASPFRSPDGTLTADGVAGRVFFKRLGCDFCHSGADATDSARGKLHDIGTLKTTSGGRGGEPLLGIDTPSLNGVWETAPYLHDGSAATVRDVLSTANPDDRHGFTSSLSEEQLAQLVSYVLQLDGTVDPEDPTTGGSSAGGAGPGGGSAGSAGTNPLGASTSSDPKDSGGCSLSSPAPQHGFAAWLLLALALGRRRLLGRRQS